jgi:tetratricopeptide (TPR) repeat protein
MEKKLRVTEAQYIETLERLISKNAPATLEQLALVDEAVRVFPQSPRLLCMRGDLVQLAPTDSPRAVAEALQSYLRAIEVSPGFANAYVETGYYYDVHEDDPAQAESFFRRAIELGAGVQAYAGLGRVLAELGRKQEATSLLKACPHSATTEVAEVLREIESGIWRS